MTTNKRTSEAFFAADSAPTVTLSSFQGLFTRPLLLIGLENLISIVEEAEPSRVLRMMKLHRRYLFSLYDKSKPSVPCDIHRDEIVNYMASYMERTLSKQGMNKHQRAKYIHAYNQYKTA